MRYSVFATFTLSQVGIIITSIVCMAALGTSLYYNREVRAEKNAYQTEINELKSNHDKEIKLKNKLIDELTDDRNAMSNMVVYIQGKMDDCSRNMMNLSNELETAFAQIEHEKEWANTLSNQALNAIYKLKSRNSQIRMENESLTKDNAIAHERADRALNIAENTARKSKNSTTNRSNYCLRCNGTGWIPGKSIERNINGIRTFKPGTDIRCPMCNRNTL